MADLGHLPWVGESVVVDGRTLTVTELDGRRASRIRVTLRRPAGEDIDPVETGARSTPSPMEESGA